jgi:hypothetical protein
MFCIKANCFDIPSVKSKYCEAHTKMKICQNPHCKKSPIGSTGRCKKHKDYKKKLGIATGIYWELINSVSNLQGYH